MGYEMTIETQKNIAAGTGIPSLAIVVPCHNEKEAFPVA